MSHVLDSQGLSATDRTVPSSRGLIIAAVTIVYCITLHWAYRDHIAPSFAGAGFHYREPDNLALLNAYALSAILAVALPRRVSRPSSTILWILFVTAVLPCVVLSQATPVVTKAKAVELSLVASGAFLFIRLLVACRPSPIIRMRPRPNRLAWHVPLLVASACIYALVIATTGLRLQALGLLDVYDVRRAFASQSGAIPLFGYILPIQYTVLNPALMAGGFYRRQPVIVLAGVAGQVLLYLTTGHKSILVSTVAVCFFSYLLRRRGSLDARLFPAGVLVTALASIVAKVATGSGLAVSFLLRRALILPGLMATIYVSVFDAHPRTYFRELIPGMGVATPVNTVGEVFFGNPSTNANVSFIGHGYAAMGYLGILLEAAALVLLLWLADDAADGLPSGLGGLLFVVPALALASSNVFTSILSHGFLWAILIAWFFPRDRELFPESVNNGRRE